MKQLELKGGVEVPVQSTSSQWALNWRDIVQSAILAAISGALNLVIETLDKGELSFDWKGISIFAATTFISNILRKLPQSGKVVLEKKEISEARK